MRIQLQKLIHIFLFLGSCILYSCSATRHLKEDEILLRKTNIEIKSPISYSERSNLKDGLNYLLPQKPNTYLFGLFPYKVWLYNLNYNTYQADSSNFQIKSRFVESPVIFDRSYIQITTERMANYLKNEGFYYATIHQQLKVKNKKAKLKYQINTGTNYLVDTLKYNILDTALAPLENEIKSNSLFVSGSPYNNTLAGSERSRIANEVRNHGYYTFSTESISFELDTLNKNRRPNRGNMIERIFNVITFKKRHPQPTLNIKTIIQPPAKNEAVQKYYIQKIIVYPDFKDSTDFRNTKMQIENLNNIEFHFHKKYVNHPVIEKKIFLRPGKAYSEADYNKTIRELNDLGIFQYVRLFVSTNNTSSRNGKADSLMTIYIIMNPGKKYDFNTNFEVSGGDLYTIGSAINLSISDRNLLKGANNLTTSLNYGIELSQHKGLDQPFFKQFYFSSQNLGLNFQLTFPKFLLPARQSLFKQRYVPKTIMNAGINSLNRINYFSLRSYNGSFGYTWRGNRTNVWTVKPLFTNVLSLSNIDPSFQIRMDSILAIKNSYQETFIQGESLEFVYSTEGLKKNQYTYVKLGFEEAGGLLSGINAISKKIFPSLKFDHAQYIRLDFDVRQYQLHPKSSFVFRFYGGIGLPYNKSSVMPYIKQYYSGGAYSLRGWRPRILGPGHYYNEKMQESRQDNLFLDQTGDIKLEWNGEYRFHLFKLFSGAIRTNGAVFADAGNIWLLRKDPQLEGAEFHFNHLYQDLAVSSGAGLRVDFGGFLVLRFDWAFPLKQPYIFDNHGWVINDIQFFNKEWRKRNLNLNIAIGYPF